MRKLIAIFLLFIPLLCGAVESIVPVEDTANIDIRAQEAKWFGEGSNYADDSKVLVNSILTGMKEFQSNFYQKSQPIGQKLYLLLATITLAWAGIQIALSSGDSSFGGNIGMFIKTIFLAGFVYYIVQPSGFELLVRGTLEGLTNELAQIALPEGATIETGFLNFTAAQMDLLGRVWENTFDFELFEFVKIGFNLVFIVLLVIMFVICSVISFVAFLSASLTQIIAFSLAPIFIATLVNQKTSFLFDGWLKFTIAACFTKVIICVLVSVGLFTFERIITANAAGLMTLFSSVVAGGLIARQMLAAPEIAQSLTSGGAVGFSKLVTGTTRTLASGLKK